MSSNLMDTEPGGRNTQYESIKTVTNPTAKEPGQLGHGSTTTTDAPNSGSTTHKTANAATQVSPAEKIRFGQAVSEEGGVTGYTDPAMAGTGRAAHAGGFGGTEALVEEGGGRSGEAQRKAQGYGGKADMDGGVGA